MPRAKRRGWSATQVLRALLKLPDGECRALAADREFIVVGVRRGELGRPTLILEPVDEAQGSLL